MNSFTLLNLLQFFESNSLKQYILLNYVESLLVNMNLMYKQNKFQYPKWEVRCERTC